MARPYWSGQIQISLVSFGVKLFPATEAKSEIRFHQLSRKTGEQIVIRNDITVKIVEVRNGVVRLGITAPKDVSIHREEIFERIAAKHPPPHAPEPTP